MWNLIELEPIPGRVRAVSAPDHRQMLVVWTTDGLYGLWFGRAATSLRMGSSADAERAFDTARGVLAWRGAEFSMHGECGAPGTRYGCELPARSPQGDRLAFDPAGRLTGIDAPEDARVAITDAPRAGKWAAIGFSADGRYLLVADEWDVRLFRYAPPKGRPVRAHSVDQLALVRAIATEPNDDTPRLVYADWLQENAQPERAEFIRLQCAHARQLRAGKFFAGAEREQELLARFGDVWQAEYPVIRGVTWSGFWRGFPGVTVLNAGTLARNAKAIWDAAPVESVVVQKMDLKSATALAKCPFLDRLRVLEFRNYRADSAPLHALVGGAALSGLWWLAFGGNTRLDAPVLEVVASSDALRNLEILTLRWCSISDAGALALVASSHMNNLRELDLTGNAFTADVPSALRKRFPGVHF
ncbi:TIGR02996 domain-containing protein [Gemmata sp. G18]|uniref:TIGR02996 domain-containing protein n=1 Tax=Gemmata palustris TaxID=2822762 RepID=A0ABS5BUQ6_9BACT|nr:TIGR02996 domain-containing protein [Gemmata palustris]MBP3957441.1 TIGR02996 domain-containing protein [Gemmata palustris]